MPSALRSSNSCNHSGLFIFDRSSSDLDYQRQISLHVTATRKESQLTYGRSGTITSRSQNTPNTTKREHTLQRSIFQARRGQINLRHLDFRTHRCLGCFPRAPEIGGWRMAGYTGRKPIRSWCEHTYVASIIANSCRARAEHKSRNGRGRHCWICSRCGLSSRGLQLWAQMALSYFNIIERPLQTLPGRVQFVVIRVQKRSSLFRRSFATSQWIDWPVID